ncbi:serine hydrolase domain-containing protein [Lacticaseibacillus saniviri]
MKKKWVLLFSASLLLLVGVIGFAFARKQAPRLHQAAEQTVIEAPRVTQQVNDKQVQAKSSQKPKPLVKPSDNNKTDVAFSEQVRVPALDTTLQQAHFAGTALVVRQGQVMLSKAYGEADRQTHRLNAVNTTYMIGSAQKSIIATAILQLEAAKKLQVDDPIAKYLPDFPNGHVITLRNLLNHTSGIVGYEKSTGSLTPAALIAAIEHAGIRSQPGTWHYLDSNYSVLAYVVTQLSHQSLPDYVQAHIFKPAGIQNSGFYPQFNATVSPSHQYKIVNNQVTSPALPDFTQLFGAGDIYMTATDVYRFDQALMTGKLIPTAERQLMLTPGSSSTYGMGFYVNPGSYSSHGVLGGWNVINSFSHSGQTTIVLLANDNGVTSLGQTADALYAQLDQNG